MDLVARFDRIASYFLDCLASGNSSVSKYDVIGEDGTVLGPEAIDVWTKIRRGGVDVGGDGSAVDALETIVETWSNGFELASGEDLTTDDETVASAFERYRTAANSPTTAARTP